jgi:hypothetical protein
VASSHRVLAFRRHADQLGAPFAVQRIEELDKHVEDVQRRVAIKHGNGHEVQIEQLALQTDAHAQAEERLATVSAAIARHRKGPDHVVVEQCRQSSADWWRQGRGRTVQRSDHFCLTTYSPFRAVLGVLDGTRHLPKRHADADEVNGQL